MTALFVRAKLALALLAFNVFAPLPAQAAVGALLPPADSAEEAPAEPEAQATPIDDTQDAGADDRIQSRISGIFGQLPALSKVEVSVNEGVVALSGVAPDQEAIDRAEGIAGQIQGVAAVENGIERDVSLGESLSIVERFQEAFADFIKMLPLLGMAAITAIVIAGIGYLIASPTRFWQRIAPNTFLAELIASAIRFVFVIGGLVVALDMIGAGALLGAVLGGAGVVGIALGFAMRDTIENYVASLMLSLRQPFRAKDHVLIDDLEGRVIRLTSRATVLMTLDGNHLRIPNGQVFKAVITNLSRNPQRRFQFDLGIDADDSADAGRRTGRAALAALPFVLADPPPEARTVDVGDSSIVLRFLGWVDQREADWYRARSKAIAAVKVALEDAGFGLPEPIYRLRFDSRTDPLPFQNIERQGNDGASSAPAPAPAAKSATVTELDTDHEDVKPRDEIGEMVDRERQEEPEAGRADLLDSSRPVE